MPMQFSGSLANHQDSKKWCLTADKNNGYFINTNF